MITSDYDVRSRENGIYLCANCHTKVDAYPEVYTYQYLKQIKQKYRHDLIEETKRLKTQNETTKIMLKLKPFTLVSQSQELTMLSSSEGNIVKKSKSQICPYCGTFFLQPSDMSRHKLHYCYQRPKPESTISQIATLSTDETIPETHLISTTTDERHFPHETPSPTTEQCPSNTWKDDLVSQLKDALEHL